MFSALRKVSPTSSSTDSDANPPSKTVETRVWLEEHEWLLTLLKSEKNASPCFRMPDLISSCVTLTLKHPTAVARIFHFLSTDLIARAPLTARRREEIWRPQYEALLELQRCPGNQHPNPKFQLDHFTTACVALSRTADRSGEDVLHHARINILSRSLRGFIPR